MVSSRSDVGLEVVFVTWQFMLMELEINEPYLFLGSSPGAAVRFANAIEATLGGGQK